MSPRIFTYSWVQTIRPTDDHSYYFSVQNFMESSPFFTVLQIKVLMSRYKVCTELWKESMVPSKYAPKISIIDRPPCGYIRLFWWKTKRPRHYSHIHLALLITFMIFFCVVCTANPFFYFSSLFWWKKMNIPGSGIYKETTCESYH